MLPPPGRLSGSGLGDVAFTPVAGAMKFATALKPITCRVVAPANAVADVVTVCKVPTPSPILKLVPSGTPPSGTGLTWIEV